MEGDKDGIHITYKGTMIHFNRSPKDGLYYLHDSRVQNKSETNILFII